jgi:GT2 family glycosyltransferase
MMLRDVELSVVVPTYNGERTIVDCLTSIERAIGPRAAEIIVADSSKDATPALVSSRFPRVRLLSSNARMSAGGARNHAVAVANGSLVFFTDQDCLVPPDWIDRLETHLRDPAIDGAGGAVAIRNFASASGCALYFLEFLNHFPANGRPRRDVGFLVGCNAAYRASVFRTVRFPDQTVGEDVLFGCELLRQGFHTVHDSTIEVLHQNKEGWKTFFDYNYRMGQASANYQSALGSRSGGVALRHPIVAFGAPLFILPAIARRLARSHRGYLGRFSRLAPMCLLGNLWWAVGFWREARLRAGAPDNMRTRTVS